MSEGRKKGASAMDQVKISKLATDRYDPFSRETIKAWDAEQISEALRIEVAIVEAFMPKKKPRRGRPPGSSHASGGLNEF